MKSLSFIPFVFFAFAMAISLNSSACTTFVIQSGEELVFGRNLDWNSNDGLICVNYRNVQKYACVFPPERSVEWVSQYGSVTFNQFGKEFPFGGMNEKGLVIEIMVAPAQYESEDDRKAINELQWIQYHLDRSSSVQEVLDSHEDVRISSIHQQLHYLICDASGDVAVIEFIDGERVLHRGSNLPYSVLENDLYNTSLRKFEQGKNCRFKRAVDSIQDFEANSENSVIDESFSILDDVALTAEWSIVYDLKRSEIHFKTSSNDAISLIDMKSINFNCQATSMMYDLKRKGQGRIVADFQPFTHEANEAKMSKAIKQNEVNLPRPMIRTFLNFQQICECALD